MNDDSFLEYEDRLWRHMNMLALACTIDVFKQIRGHDALQVAKRQNEPRTS